MHTGMKLHLPARFRDSRVSLASISLVGCLVLSGCGKPATPETNGTDLPSPSPGPTKPSAVVQPPGEAGSERIVFVVTSFQAMTSEGTYDVPVGAAVKVLEDAGDELQIEYKGFAVRTPKTFFSDQPISAPGTAAATPDASPAAEVTPDATPGMTESETLTETVTESISTEAASTPEVPAEWRPDPEATPDPALTADTEKTSELIGEIRTLNEEIRTASDKMEVAAPDEKSAEARRVEQLKKKRDALSADLTEVAKP